jgi:predicted small lipoprotein YifL
MKYRTLTIAVACLAVLGTVSGCEKKGPFEKAGENIDEAGRTVKNGGEKTTGDKVHDAAEDVNDSAHDAAKDLKK